MKFRGWLNEDDGHDYGDELDEIILRTRNPEIKRRLQAMRDGDWSNLVPLTQFPRRHSPEEWRKTSRSDKYCPLYAKRKEPPACRWWIYSGRCWPEGMQNSNGHDLDIKPPPGRLSWCGQLNNMPAQRTSRS